MDLVPYCSKLTRGLPETSGNTVILIVIDHFSKTSLLITLPKLLYPLDTAKHFFIKYFEFMVSRLTISDWGP